MQSPPAVSLVFSISSLCGLKSQVKLPYVASFLLLMDTCSFPMNLIESVPVTCLPTPCARHPNSLGDDFDQIALCLGAQISYW